MRRILYIGYFIKNTQYSELLKDFRDITKEENISHIKLFYNMISSSFLYTSSFHDYFTYELYNKSKDEIQSYLMTGESYELYSSLNDKNKVINFVDKAKFNQIFKDFVIRDFIFMENSTLGDFIEWTADKDCLIAKPNEGVTGQGIEKIHPEEYENKKDLYKYLGTHKLDLIEECIEQHVELNRINPSSVNTIRIITIREYEDTDIIAAVLRMGVGKHVDNFSAGGIAAPVDISTGIVFKPAVAKDSKETYDRHPLSDANIIGFKIPYWEEVIKMVTDLSKIIPEVKTVGWDIAITPKGPEVIEGNNNWNKNTFQLPYGKGRKHIVKKYM